MGPVTKSTAALLLLLLAGCGSSGGTGGHGGSSGTGAAGGSEGEDCLDGIDDDSNGAIDCADTACQLDFACVDAPVSGWTGALWVQKIAYPAASPPSLCPDGKPPAVYFTGPSAPECNACDCKLNGAACTAPEMTCKVLNTTCIATNNFVKYHSDDTACKDAFSPFGSSACWLTSGAALLTPGACAVSGGGLKRAEPWAEEVRVCAAAGGGCASGKVCAPRVPAGFEPSVCMRKEGAALCPAGWTDLDLAVYEGGKDNRACSGCGCDVSKVHCIGGKYTLHAGNGCSAANTIEVDSNACKPLNAILTPPDAPYSVRPEFATPTGLECINGVPSGSVETSGAHRICCRKGAP
jgi:hypothetical protein